MSFKSLAFKPGINTQLSKTLLGDGYSNSQLIRWMFGQPQKYGGWQRLSSTPLTGTCRGIFGWSDLYGNPYLACGTEQKLEIYYGGSFFDITPISTTSTLSAATKFSTTAGSNVVTITDTGYSPSAGDWINILVPVSIGTAGSSIVLQGEYKVQTVNVGANTYTINAASPAIISSTAGNVPQYATTASSTTITVTLNNHGYVAGNSFTVHYTTSVGGITIAPVVTTGAGAQSNPPTSYSITTATTNTFTFSISAGAASTASAYENGANNAVVQYYLPNGYSVNTVVATGGGNALYGSGVYGSGPYGGATQSGSVVTPLRQWSLSSWGQTLIANPTNGNLYYWIPYNSSTNPLAFTTSAQVISGAPTLNKFSLVIPQAQILVSFGAESGGTQYQNLVRWSDVSNYNSWNATATNQAGSFSIPTGSRIVAAMVSGLTVLIWTDTDLYTMTYQGLPFVFDFQKIGLNCEAISQKSVGVIGQQVCWPSDRGFYQFNGAGVQPLICPVWDYFFNNIDLTQSNQVFCATNTLFTEFMWFFPFNDNSGNIGYVKYNIVETTWDTGLLTRTAWCDHSVFGNPIGVDGSSLLQVHEVGNNADISPMTTSITTGYQAIGDGENFYYVDQFYPDVVTEGTSPQMQLTLYSLNSQNDTPVVYGPYTYTTATQFVPIRVRGRLLAYTLQSSDPNSFWRIGKPYLRIAPAGRR